MREAPQTMSLRRYLMFTYIVVLLVDAALLAVNAAMNAGVIMPLEVMDAQLDLKDEGNLAVWWSSVQWLLAAVAATLIAAFVTPSTGGSRMHAIAWLGVALLMLGLSADEAAQLHEWIGQRYADYAGGNNGLAKSLRINDIYAWLIVGVPIALICAAFLLTVAWRWMREHRRSAWMAVAAVLCLFTAMIAEYVESQYFADLGRRYKGWRGHQATIEEGAELLAAAFLLIAFLEYLRAHSNRAPLARLDSSS